MSQHPDSSIVKSPDGRFIAGPILCHLTLDPKKLVARYASELPFYKGNSKGNDLVLDIRHVFVQSGLGYIYVYIYIFFDIYVSINTTDVNLTPCAAQAS